MKFRFWDFKNLRKQKVPSQKEDKSGGYVKWEAEGGKNNFPQQLLQNVDNSPAGSAAIDVWAEFTVGDGLANPEDNIDLTGVGSLNKLHAKIGSDLAYMWGFAFIIKYNIEGQRTAVFHLPFEETRLGIPNDAGKVEKIYHNPYFGIPKSFDDKETKWFYPYNADADFVKDQIARHNQEFQKDGEVTVKYPGQVYWFSIERPLSRFYPKPFYYSTMGWFILDDKVQAFHERNIDNNLLLSVMINVNGDPDAPAGPPDSRS